MRLTAIHLAYWAARHAPAWAAAIPQARGPLASPRPTVDQCVNAHGQPQDARLEASNAVALLRRMQGPHEVLDLLSTMAQDSTRHGAQSRRAAFARRWLQRIKNERAREWFAARAGLPVSLQYAFDMACIRDGVEEMPRDLARAAMARIVARISHDDISRYETHEILTPADMRMLQAAHEEQQAKPERTSWFHRWQNLPRSRPPGW